MKMKSIVINKRMFDSLLSLSNQDLQVIETNKQVITMYTVDDVIIKKVYNEITNSCSYYIQGY